MPSWKDELEVEEAGRRIDLKQVEWEARDELLERLQGQQKRLIDNQIMKLLTGRKGSDARTRTCSPMVNGVLPPREVVPSGGKIKRFSTKPFGGGLNSARSTFALPPRVPSTSLSTLRSLTSVPAAPPPSYNTTPSTTALILAKRRSQQQSPTLTTLSAPN
eukprot:TRINITY_DN17210_c0_g1_i1.p1 TRINITY_DN17210_c0_g1~~TRINITY_DN17210_c0_g1_i1.p1  ORF type:complete len:172 (+),score=27.56 TRINITY_DN17210_c0_g1_i1:35-517(+)